jgi:hypothetical protein
MEAPQVLILLHQRDIAFDSNDYLVKFLMKECREMGCSDEVRRGIRQQVQADLVISHVDLTITPQEYLDFFRAYPNVMNRHVVDISKSRISVSAILLFLWISRDQALISLEGKGNS